MKRTALSAALALAFLTAATASVSGQSRAGRLTIASIDTGRGATLRFIHLAPPTASADALILLTGGMGVLALDRRRKRLGNFLVRSRSLFAAEGFRVIVPDTPGDRPRGLAGNRTSAWHGGDLARLASWARRQGARRVWVVGTSRGTIGAANVAARPQSRIDGVVLTSSLLVSGGRFPGSVFDVPLARIRQPVLIVHHNNDECRQTPPGMVPELARSLTGARKVTVRMVSGGTRLEQRGRRRNAVCGPWSHHGFLGVEPRVVRLIVDWVRAGGR